MKDKNQLTISIINIIFLISILLPSISTYIKQKYFFNFTKTLFFKKIYLGPMLTLLFLLCLIIEINTVIQLYHKKK